MKRLQIMIEEEVDEALALEAKRQGTSKADLIRRFVRSQLGPLARLDPDPLEDMIGVDDYEPVPIDDVVYR